ISTTAHGFPYTCVAKIAVVFSVIAASILVWSIFKVSESISTKTGVQPSHTMLLVVATNEKGVVMISPFKSNALMAICSATVPLVLLFVVTIFFVFISKLEKTFLYIMHYIFIFFVLI